MTEKSVCLSIPFPSLESAALAYEVLIIDKEHRRSEVRRELSTDSSYLKISLHGTDFKKLRVALNSVLKHILLIAKTVDMFNGS